MDANAFIIEALNEPLGKVAIMKVAANAIDDASVLEALFLCIYEGQEPLCWRAAWVVEKVCASVPSLVAGEYHRMVQQAMADGMSDGLRRLLLRILYNLPEATRLDVGFFNFLLGIMTDPKSSPGVQSLALKLADRMSLFDVDLHEEFLCVLRNMELRYYSPGVNAAVRKCLKRKR